MQDRIQLGDRDPRIEGIGIGAREPMATTAQQPVTGPGITLKIPGFEQVVQPQQHRKIDVSRCVLPSGKPCPPAVQPGLSQGFPCRLLQPRMHRRNQRIGVIEETNGLKVQIEIRRSGRPNTDGVHAGVTQTEEIVEDDGMHGVTQLEQTL